jgi:hypothetical protein
VTEFSGTERSEPTGLSDERGLLDGWLDYYRATLLAKCEGLTGEQLVMRSCAPSSMSLLGLVRHMTEMERVYGHRLADRSVGFLYCTDENRNSHTLRWFYQYLIKEYARHLGHADLLRERIDGSTGE